MASTQDLKRRVRSITNTRKLTKAMELVASARLRRAQSRIEAMRPYADRMLELMGGVSQAAGSVRLPLLQRRDDVRRVALVPVTADRGLAGAFNAQVLRRAFVLQREAVAAGQEVIWFSSGKKAASTLRFRRLEVGHSGPGSAAARRTPTRRRWRMRWPTRTPSEQVDRVVVVYNAFVSPLVQKVTVREILPIPTEMLQAHRRETKRRSAVAGDFIYEPEPEEILARLLPSISRRSSTGHCSSRPHPRRARA